MRAQAAYEKLAGHYVVRTQDLFTDHRLLRALLDRFEMVDESFVRRDLIEVVLDLFELHSAIERQVCPADIELSREYAAVYELIEGLEEAEATSPYYFFLGLELKRVFEAYLSKEESITRQPETLHLQRTNSNGALLRERASLVEYAMGLLRVH